MLILINHIRQMHNPAEFIPEIFDPVRFYETITYTRPETHGEIHEMKTQHIRLLEEETYATCFTDLPFLFSSIIFNYHRRISKRQSIWMEETVFTSYKNTKKTVWGDVIGVKKWSILATHKIWGWKLAL